MDDPESTVKRVLPILFLFMSLAVATREIPELYNLSDDPSNDGQVFCWQDATPVYPNHCAEHSDPATSPRVVTPAPVENGYVEVHYSAYLPDARRNDELWTIVKIGERTRTSAEV
jgi:hypothetical protein